MFFRKELKIISIVFVGLLVSFAMADVSHNADFPISGLSIQAILEPADSNYYHHIDVTGCWSRTELLGYPEMPCKLINLLIPADEAVSGITIDDSIGQEIEGSYDVYPAQDTRMIDESKPPFVPPDSAAYSSTTPYPGKLAEVVHNGYHSGYHLVTVRLYPIQYVPAEQRLTFYTKIVFTVQTRAGVNNAVPVYRRSSIVQARMEKLVSSLVENPEMVDGQRARGMEQRVKDTKPLVITGLPSIEGECVDYVIITNEALRSVFQPLADWKTKKGIVTQVRTIEWISGNYTGCDLQERIRNFITDAYSYWGVGYVLLAGDTRIISERKGLGWIPTDLYYSDLEGNWNFDGTILSGWPQPTTWVCWSPGCADIDNDLDIDLYITSDNINTNYPPKIYFWDIQGQSLLGWPVNFPGAGATAFSVPAVADLDRDGNDEVIGVSHVGYVCVWYKNGEIAKGWPQYIGLKVLHSSQL